MAKIDDLLKKATSFEKLAFYLDRKSFLQALAESEFEVPGWKNIENLFQKAYQMVNNAGGDVSPLQDAWQFKKNPSALAQAITQAANSLIGLKNQNISTQLIDLARNVSMTANNTTLNNKYLENVHNIKPVEIQGYSPVPKEIQNALNVLINSNLKIDGLLGPKTKQAIEDFKTKYNVPGNFNDKDTYRVILKAFQRNNT